MKMSLRLMTFEQVSRVWGRHGRDMTNVLMAKMLEEFQFTICALGEDRRAEGLHDLLDGNGLACELVLCGAGGGISSSGERKLWLTVPDQPKGTHTNRLQISISTAKVLLTRRECFGGGASDGTCW